MFRPAGALQMPDLSVKIRAREREGHRVCLLAVNYPDGNIPATMPRVLMSWIKGRVGAKNLLAGLIIYVSC